MRICIWINAAVLAGLSFFTFQLCLNAQSTNVDAGFIQSVLSAQYESIQDIKVEIHVAGFDAQNKAIYRQEMLWIKKKEKEYLSMTTGTPDAQWEKIRDMQAWNEERATTWVTDPTKTNDPGSGRIMFEKPKLLTATIAQRYVMSCEGKAWPRFLKDNPGEILTEQDTNGLYCVYGNIRMHGLPIGVLRYKAWFDPRYDFMPVKWLTEEMQKDGPMKVQEEYRVLDIQTIGRLSFPKKLIRKTWNGGHEDVDLKIDLDSGVPDSQFEIHWMPGTGVWDGISQHGYFVANELENRSSSIEHSSKTNPAPHRTSTGAKKNRVVIKERFPVRLLGIVLVFTGALFRWQAYRFPAHRVIAVAGATTLCIGVLLLVVSTVF